ncbi:MAG: class D sortase [Anaerolineaceae bacterium]|nr:class D sortase [Anaerolineaceae bacterium]
MALRKNKPWTEEDLRFLLLEKTRTRRQARYQHFTETGEFRAEENESVTGMDLPDFLQEAQEEKPARKRISSNPTLDRVLFAVEALAIIGLLFILFNGISVVQGLNREFAAALVQPTMTPTPVVMAVVLPSGHTFADAARQKPIPNDAEIPEHLRPIVQSMAEIPIPTKSPQQAIRLQIPSIDIDAPIVQGDGWEQLKKGVAQHLNSSLPGQKNNLILSAHNDIFGEIFRDLDQLENGDIIRVFTSQTTYEYVVFQTQIVEPTQVEVMKQTNDAIVTLISCYPYRVDNQRIVVTAKLKQ